jgi:hypothetical protein
MKRIMLDGFDIFKAIGTHRDVFSSVGDKIAKAAETLVLGQIKATGPSVVELGNLLSAIGDEYFSIALDHFGTNDLKKILKKIDPHFFVAEETTDADMRQRIHGLAGATTTPAAKAPVVPKVKKSSKKRMVKEAEWPAAMSPPARKVS